MNEKFTPGNWRGDPVTGNIYPEGVEYAIAGAYSSPVSPEEYEANLRLIANAPALYSVLLQVRPFFSHDGHIREQIEKLLREINPNFDKNPEVTDIKVFAERVKNMRDWQIKHAEKPSDETQKYSRASEFLIDCLVVQILQEASHD